MAKRVPTPTSPAAPTDTVQISGPRPSSVARLGALLHRAADAVFYGALTLAGGGPVQSLLWFGKPPDGLPRSLWKAFHKDADEARSHYDRIQRLKCSEPARAAILEDYAHVERKLYHGTDLRTLLDGIDGRPDAAGYFHDFRLLADRDHNMSQAVADVKLVDGQAKAASVPLDEAASVLSALRKGETATHEEYERFNDDAAALAYVLAGRDASERARRLSWIQEFRVHHRTVPQAMALETAVTSLQCDASTRDAVRGEFRSIVRHWSGSEDGSLRDGLQAVDGPDPRPGLAWVRTLLDATRRPSQAVADLRAAQQRSVKHGVPTEEVVGIIAALRHADPARGDEWASFGTIDPVLDEVLAEKDPSTRRAALDGIFHLAVKKRSPAGVVPLFQQLGGAGGPAGLRGDVRHLLKHVPPGDDAAVLEALKTAQAGTDARAAFQQFAELVHVTGRARQALSDVGLAAHAAATSGCAPADVLLVVRELRQADPARKDEYSTFANLQDPLAALLQHPGGTTPPDRQALQEAAGRFLQLQKHGRGAGEALAHERALAAVPGTPAERADFRERYAKLVKHYSSSADSALLGMLGEAARSGAPLPTLERFERLLDVTGRPAQALADLQSAAKAAASHQVDADEGAALLAALRSHDPARKEEYGSFADPAPALDFVLAAPTPDVRRERAESVAAIQKRKRELAAALQHAQHLDGVTDPSVRAAYGKLLSKFSSRWDSTLQDTLDFVKRQPRPAAAMATYRALAKASLHPDDALGDLKQVSDRAARTGLPLDDVAELVERMRRGDPYRKEEYYSNHVDLASALDVALSGPAARDRDARARVFARLWHATGSAPGSLRDLQWIVAAPAPPDGLAAATGRLVRLEKKVGASESTLHTLFDRTEAYVQKNPPRWWERLLHLHSRYERTVYRVVKTSGTTDEVLPLMDSLSAGVQPGEPITGALKRFRALLKIDGEYANVDQVRQAWDAARVPVACGAIPSGEAGWVQFLEMAKSVKSARAAGMIWSAMAQAATPAEMEARRRAYDALFQAARGYLPQALTLYQAAAQVLGPTDAMADAVAELQTLLEHQHPDVAAESFVVARSSASMSPPEQKALQDILTFARTASDIHALFGALTTACADTTLTERAQILQTLLAQTAARDAIRQFAQVGQELAGKGELASTGPALAGLMAVMAERGLPGSGAHDLMAWLREMRASRQKDDPDMPGLSEMLMSLTASLLVGGDVDSAKEQLRVAEDRRIHARMTGGSGGRIEVGNGVVDVGGIRIAVRQPQKP